jgi:protease I
MAGKLDRKKVAILVADGFEQVEMAKPREALDEAGAETKIVSLKGGKIQGMHHADKGDKFDVDLAVKDARPNDFDALMIPGGLFNPDALRSDQSALAFCRGQELIEEVSRREEWLWAKWLLIAGIMTFFALSIQVL